MRLSEKEWKAYCKSHNIKYDNPQKKIDKEKVKDDFDSNGERGFYAYFITPRQKTGEIVKCEMHKSFVIADADDEYGLKQKVFTPDFIVTWNNGSTEVFEIKGEQVKKLQRDYQLRKHIFILRYCKPQGWKYTEIKSEEWSQ